MGFTTALVLTLALPIASLFHCYIRFLNGVLKGIDNLED
jgi:hypothetical protein